MKEHINLEASLEHRQQEIKDKIHFAFEHLAELNKSNASIINSGVKAIVARQDVRNAEAYVAKVTQALSQVASPDEINLYPKKEAVLNEVVIAESHLYPYLLEQVFLKALELSQKSVNRHWIAHKIDAILAHEYLHAAPGLQQEGLEIKYGVAVYKDMLLGGFSIRPLIQLEGVLGLNLYRDILTNPDPKTYSVSDQIKKGI